MLLISGAYECC